jgi:hypothetical protein
MPKALRGPQLSMFALILTISGFAHPHFYARDDFGYVAEHYLER